MKLEWGTTGDVTVDVHGEGPFANAAIDDHAIVIDGALEQVIVIEGAPEELLAWAEGLVAKVVKATGMEPHAPAGSTVYILRNGDATAAYASRKALMRESARIARDRWDEIAGDPLNDPRFNCGNVPDSPPEKDELAASMFETAIENQGDGYHHEWEAPTIEA